MTRWFITIAAVAVIATVTACNASGDEDGIANGRATVAQQSNVDSIFPMDTMIARYQANFTPVTGFEARSPGSIDELIDRFAAAVRDSSGIALDSLTMTETEFAYLYFPTSIHSRPPYAQPPAVNWLLLEQNSLKGRHRLLRTFGGSAFIVSDWRCNGDVRIEGRNRIRDGCVVRVQRQGEYAEMRLFGSIIERDGRFRFLSLANRL